MPNQLLSLTGFAHDSGHCYTCAIAAPSPGDSAASPTGSTAELFEDGVSLGPPHAAHDQIRHDGRGRFSHWHNHLYLSASDNSDPRKNGRRYSLYLPESTMSDRQRSLTGLIAKVAEGTPPLEAYGVAEAIFNEVFPDGFLGEFGKACWTDREFVATYDRLVPGNRRSFERKYVVSQLVRSLGHVPGDIAECGVYNGATAYFMAAAARASGRGRELHLFDSFEGLSAPQPRDGSFWTAGALAISEQHAIENLREFTGCHIYRGWIPDRFAEVGDRRFAFVHIDVDLYQPTFDSLSFFYPRVVEGGMILCDDSGFVTCPGARAAIADFMATRAERPISLPTGQDLIIKREPPIVSPEP